MVFELYLKKPWSLGDKIRFNTRRLKIRMGLNFKFTDQIISNLISWAKIVSRIYIWNQNWMIVLISLNLYYPFKLFFLFQNFQQETILWRMASLCYFDNEIARVVQLF